ncbi:MAG: hypothetical protein AAFR58_15190 [Cyanobacteria bacterium J06627_28]
MKRFVLSAASVLLATAALAPTAQAFSQIDSDFNLQTLRLGEFDGRSKSGEAPYYPETSAEGWSQEGSAEQASEPTEWEAADTQEEETPTALSITERRHQSLDRS